MRHSPRRGIARRRFLAQLATGSAGLLWTTRRGRAGGPEPTLLAGEGVVDTTPPLGLELGGFHRPPGQERRIRGIRQRTQVRALVLKLGETQLAILSLDVATVSSEMAKRVQQQVAQKLGIAAENVRLCATHTHSMPSFVFCRQWGAIPVDYMHEVERKCVEAVALAREDLAPARVSLGKSRTVKANFNRTTNPFKTDEQFTKESTDSDRWLDTMLHVLLVERSGGKRSLAWYHFSAHAVCYADEQAGPDWPGEVADRVRAKYGLQPSFLQGHIGDVNPGDGDPWRGDIRDTVGPVFEAFCRAMDQLKAVPVDSLRSITHPFAVPLDLELFGRWLEEYRRDPGKCATGNWVDAGFAEDWYRGNVGRNPSKTHLPIELTAVRLGPIGLLLHPAELYSYYGLAIRRDSPFADTLVVGYTNGCIGYLPDPRAYASDPKTKQAGEYAAIVVPKILDIPPYRPTAAREMTAAAIGLLKEAAS